MVVLYDKIVYIEKVEREFIYTEPFLRCWKAIGLGDDEQHELEDILLENPRKGVVIEGLAGIRKLRIRLEGRGKSGGGRVIYIDVLEKDLTAEQRKFLRRMVETIMEE